VTAIIVTGVVLWALLFLVAIALGKAAAKPMPLPPNIADEVERFLEELPYKEPPEE